MQVAIIGSGISGLTAAYRLSSTHDVTLFEANDYPGGHTNTVDVEIEGEHHAIDTGFIVFNDRTYPNFVAMLAELGVRSRPTSMSFSVRCDATNLEYNGSSLNGLFAQRRNLARPGFFRMLRDIMRFNREAPRLIQTQSADDEVTVGQYLAQERYSQEFAENYLLPMGAAIWSCPLGTFADFPVRFIAEFYRNHGLLSIRNRPIWRVIEGGSRRYVKQMLARFTGRLRLSSPIEHVTRTGSGVLVRPRHELATRFDHVIFACHSDQALRMLADPTATEQAVLSQFPYSRNIAILHTDPSVLPKRKRAWASWNYHLSGQRADVASRSASVTYQMNLLQHIRSRHVFNVTLNSEQQIDPARVLRRIEYHHPVFTARRSAAQSRHGELINVNRTSYCGAYWGNGFHEDGVVSALRVCESLLPTSSLLLKSPPMDEVCR